MGIAESIPRGELDSSGKCHSIRRRAPAGGSSVIYVSVRRSVFLAVGKNSQHPPGWLVGGIRALSHSPQRGSKKNSRLMGFPRILYIECKTTESGFSDFDRCGYGLWGRLDLYNTWEDNYMMHLMKWEAIIVFNHSIYYFFERGDSKSNLVW